MRQEIFKRMLFKAMLDLILIFVIFGLQYRNHDPLDPLMQVQVILFFVLENLMESPLYVWRKYVTGHSPHRRDGVYALLLLAATAVNCGLCRLAGRLLQPYFM